MLHAYTNVYLSAKEKTGKNVRELAWTSAPPVYQALGPALQVHDSLFLCTVLRNAMCALNLLVPECHIWSCLLDIWRAENERK